MMGRVMAIRGLSAFREMRCPRPTARRAGRLVVGAPWLPALLLVVAIGSSASRADEPLRLSSSPWIADAPTKVAQALDAFGDAIEIVESNSGKASLDQLLAGTVEFALMATTPLALNACEFGNGSARERVEPVVLASVALSNNTHYVLADGESGISNPADLAGRRIGVMFDTSAHFGWNRFARHAGLEAGAFELVDLPIDRLIDALAIGEIDAAVVWAPWDRRLVDRWGERARRFAIRAVDSVNWLLVTRRDVLDEHGGVAIDVLRAYARAVRLLNAEPERAARLFERVAGLSLPDPGNPAVGVIWHLALDWSLLANLQANLEWCAQRNGRPPRRVAFSALIDPAPLAAVDPSAVMLPVGLFESGAGRRGGQ